MGLMVGTTVGLLVGLTVGFMEGFFKDTANERGASKNAEFGSSASSLMGPFSVVTAMSLSLFFASVGDASHIAPIQK